jgi:transposase
MSRKVQRREPDLKMEVAVEAIKGKLSVNEIAVKYAIHPKQVTDWRDQLLGEGISVFIPKTSLRKTKSDIEKDDLLKKIGELSMENEYLKKKQPR